MTTPDECPECRGRGAHEVIIGYADPEKQHACTVEIPCPACGPEEATGDVG